LLKINKQIQRELKPAHWPPHYINTVYPFLCYKYPNAISLCLTSQNSLYLLPIAPKNLHPEPLHRVSWTHATSIRLSANASTSSPDLPVSESTFQVPTLKGQPFCSLSALGGLSCTQPSALAQGCAAFRLGFPTSCLRRHVGCPRG